MRKVRANCIVFFNGDTWGLLEVLRACFANGAKDTYFVVQKTEKEKFTEFLSLSGLNREML